jgi:hypothetical protein
VGILIPWLADAARSTGYPVIEVAGWRKRGHGGFGEVAFVVGHHTATSQSAKGDYPSLNVVTNGRAGLAGPLCNYGLGRSGAIYVIAAGVGWHAGASRYRGYTDLNDNAVGVEAEHAGGQLPWPGAQLDSYVKLVAACLRYMRRGPECYVSHRTCAVPAGRKPDPRNIPDDWMRGAVARHLAGPTISRPAPRPEESDMDARQAAQLSTVLTQITGSPDPDTFVGWPAFDGGTGETLTVVDYLRRANAETRQLRAEVLALNKTVATIRVSGAVGGLSDADVARIVAAVNSDAARRMQA